MLYILDRNEQVVGLLQSNSDRNKNIYYDDVLTEMLSSGADTFTFTSIPDRDTSKKLTVGNYIAFKKGNKFKLLQIIEVNESKEDVLTKEIYCEGAGLELINTVYSGSKMDSVNIKRFLINILQDTNWNVGYVDSNLTKTLSLDVEEKEVYSIIQEYLYDFEAEIDFRVEIKGNRIVGRYIDVYSKRGRNNGRRLEINRDIKSISRKVSLVNYATKLIGEGKNGLNFRDISMSGEINKPLGQNFVVNEEAYSRINNKGKHITRKFTYDTEDAYELLRQTHKALKEYSEPKVTYEVDADILNFDDIEIGDYVSISDLSFTPPLLVTARISELETSKTNKYANKAILSNFNEVRSGISSIFPILGEDIVSGSISGEQMNPDYVDSIISDSVNASMVKTEILLADKANISDLNATNATIENLTADFAEIDELLAGNITAENIKADSITSDHIQANTIDTKHLKADSIDANKIKADSIESKHIQSNTIDTNHLKADIIDAEHINANSITSNHIQSNTIDARHINSNSINADHIQANTITSGHIQTGSITAGSGIIADGAIGNAQISQIDAGKIEAGTIDTSKVTIQGANGHLRLKGNRMQVFQGTGNQAKERVSVGDVNGDGSVYGLRVRGADGQTILLDENGVKSEGITDGSITNDKISDDANIDGAKLNINSVVSKINEDGTETIQGTKIEVDGTTLNTKLSTITNKQTEDSERITQAQSQITANTNAIKLKVDEQTYTTDKKDMTSKLEKNTSEISTMKGQIALKVEQTDIENAKSELEGTMDSKIEGLQVGGRNLIRKANVIQNNSTATFNESTKTWTIKASAGAGGTWGCGLVLSSKNILVPYGKSYVLSFEIKVPRNCRWNVDINNYALIGSSWAGNDNDNTSKRTSSSTNLTANQWIKCWVKWENTNTNNTTKVDLYDNSNFGVVMQNETSDMTYEIRNIQGELGNMPTEYTPAPEDVDGAINSVDSKVDTLRTEYNSTKSKVATIETDLSGITSRVSSVETATTTITDLAKAMAGGKILYTDPMFKKGNNGISVYNNSNNGTVVVNRIGKIAGCPTSSTHCLEVKTTGAASPYFGGFYFGTPARANQILITRIIAKIPTGRNISWHSNATGNGSSQKWLTSTAGTGKWEEYICQVKCGTDGSFSSTNFFAIKDGSTPTTSNPLVWHIAYATVIDITDSDESVNDLTTRMSTAESKLTKDSLTTTIGNHYTTSTDVNGIVDKKGYATTSQVQQTVNGLEVKVQQSGGYNLLYNGNFKRSFEKWTNTRATIANNLSCPQNQTGILLSGALTTTKHCVQSVNMETLKPFTVSFWQYTSSAGSDGTTNPYRASQITITYSDNTKTYHSTSTQTVFDTWELRSITIKPTKRVTNVSVELWNRDTTKSVYYTNVMLEYGSIYTEWSPNPNEIYDGITTIDKDGVTVNASNVKSKTNMSANGFKITKTDTNEDVFKVNADGTLYMKGSVTVTSGNAKDMVDRVAGWTYSGTTEINGGNIRTGTLSASKITAGTLDASKVTVTNLNASNIKSGKLSANYIDATNLSVKGELLSGQINGVGGMKFADGAVISSCESGVAGYKGIQISAPVIKLGDKVEISRPTIFYDVTGKNNSSSKTTTWTMSSSGALTCTSASISGTTTVGGTLNVRNNMINGMNNLQMGRGSVYIPIFGSSSSFDYIKGGRSTIAFADTGPIHFLYNGSKSSFIAGGTVFLPHAGNVNCDHFRLGAGIMACPSSGSFHFLTANGNTSPLYAGRLYSADVLYLNEPMVISNNSVFDKINSVNVIETKNGLNLHNPISTTNDIDESPDVVKTVYNEEKDEIETTIDYTSAIATLWKAVQELKQENNELKEIIKSLCPKE